ncbi:hypothetical protein C8J57DRAFT_1072513 [Mycena rebaudengoi]|nr:hypothetical protein C8J57DRAFT_1072513 [Mycena rebaudengoi]
MREWLIEHGEKKVSANRDELVKLMQAKYHDATTTTAPYLAWQDARLRAYLRQHGMDDSALLTLRPGLLQETRIRWVQATTTFERIHEIVNSDVEAAEEKLRRVIEIVMGEGDKAKAEGAKATAAAKKGKENFKARVNVTGAEHKLYRSGQILKASSNY